MTEPEKLEQRIRALADLKREVGGQWSAFEYALREAIGNTNYQVIADKLAACEPKQ